MKIGWRQAALALAFLLSVSVVVIFVVRAVRPALYWHYHQDEPIRAWMNVGYVAPLITFHHTSLSLWGLPPTPPDKRPLREIAKSQGRSWRSQEDTSNAIVHARPPYPPPEPPPRPAPIRGF